MKSNLLHLILFVCLAGAVYSQNATLISDSSVFIKCSKFSVSKPLRDMPATSADVSEDNDQLINVGNRNESPLRLYKLPPIDPSVQREMGIQALDTPLVNFDGGNYSRPDATGAAGPNHYVQMVNYCTIKIYDKNGTPKLTTDVASIGGGPCMGDPLVLYDKFADRWLISDFTSNYYTLVVAISKTPGPTGAYYIYNFPLPTMCDFEKYNVWTDGYYVNLRTFSGGGNDTVLIGVLNRDRMLKGDPSGGMILSRLPGLGIINSHTMFPSCPKVLSCDGALPPIGKPNYLMYYTNLNCGDTSNSIVIYRLNTDTAQKKCYASLDTVLATQPFNGYFSGFGTTARIAQPNNSAWQLDGMFQYRVPYIRFTGYASVVLSHVVNLGGYVAGIRWYELRQNDTTAKWSIYQQSTYGPNDSISRWNGSICMNLDGDISLAYNVTSKYNNLYPGIRYTGRLSTDPLNQMTFTEQTAIAGNSSYGTQWGDFCESTLDPDGLTFWHTNQYIKSGTPNTRIFSWRLSTTTTSVPTVSANATIDFKVFQTGGLLNVHVSSLASDEPVVLTLFDLNGKEITSQWITPSARQFENKINVKGLPTATYLVRIGNPRFQKVVKAPVIE